MKSDSPLLSLAEQDLENARLLLDHGRYRASISRAYYAMHYGTQALLDVKNIASRSHKGMIQQFGQHFVLSGEFSREMARNLKEAYDLRQMSDYEANITITQEQAEQALAVSIEFVDRVRAYLSEVEQ
jgi:uncharacterized protein (UPF0332 family)